MSPSAGVWLEPLRSWPASLAEALRREPAVVRVVLAALQGSAPREPGACMLVGRTMSLGTIGGGQLEWDATAAARRLLDAGDDGNGDGEGAGSRAGRGVAQLRRWVLAADLGQCCGGVVEVWLERFSSGDLAWVLGLSAAARAGALGLESRLVYPAQPGASTGLPPAAAPAAAAARVERRLLRDGEVPRATQLRRGDGAVSLLERVDAAAVPVWLYGAGHVGHALARVLVDLPFNLTWIDARPHAFPAGVPAAIQVVQTDAVAASVAAAPPGTRFVVMTHSHALDHEICRAVLTREDFGWLGLIGSESKAARFRARLARDGLRAQAIARLVCPVGIPGIDSKWPAAIAVAIAAQLLRDSGAAAADAAAALGRAAAAPAQPCAAGECAGCGTETR